MGAMIPVPHIPRQQQSRAQQHPCKRNATTGGCWVGGEAHGQAIRGDFNEVVRTNWQGLVLCESRTLMCSSALLPFADFFCRYVDALDWDFFGNHRIILVLDCVVCGILFALGVKSLVWPLVMLTIRARVLKRVRRTADHREEEVYSERHPGACV